MVAEGGYVTDARVPVIKQSTPTQIAEAVRVGPYLMPKFSNIFAEFVLEVEASVIRRDCYPHASHHIPRAR